MQKNNTEWRIKKVRIKVRRRLNLMIKILPEDN